MTLDARALLDHADLAVAAVAPDWTVSDWSAGAARITGVPPDQIVGKNVWATFPAAPGWAERVLLEVLGDGRSRSYIAPARLPDLHHESFEVRVSLGPRRHLILVFREIRSDLAPESRAAHLLRAIDQERRLYRRLFEALPAPALVLTLDGQILEANPPAVTLLGAAHPGALRGVPLADWLGAGDRDRLARALRQAVSGRQELRLQLEFAREPVRELATVIEHVQPDGDVPKLLFLAVDTSTESVLQQKLITADRLAQLGALVSGVAHELNNPLAAISAFAEMLVVDAPTAGIRESGAIIHQEADRAGRVVRTLLDFARQRSRRPEPVDIGEIAERVVALQRSALKRARIKATIEIPPTVPLVFGDTQELQQVLLNGLVNAVQAIEATDRPGQILIRARRAEQHVVVTIDDTGRGVPPEFIERVFDPFFTTKGDGGTGLGLSISLGLVRGMGGRLWLENAAEGGARLVLELPAEGTPVVGETAPRVTRPTRPLSVIIVEDEATVRRAVTLMAERLGHRVTAAHGLAEARRLLAEPTRYDALLVDVHLDEAHTGFELFDDLRLQGRGEDRHVVFTTGDSVSTTTRDALARAERPVLKKPFKLEELREILDRVAGG